VIEAEIMTTLKCGSNWVLCGKEEIHTEKDLKKEERCKKGPGRKWGILVANTIYPGAQENVS
jgi:hypothetical protein